MKPRILFNRCCFAAHSSPINLNFSWGLPSSNSTSLSSVIEAQLLVGNLGNMVHRQAIVDLLDVDRNLSAQINLISLLKQINSKELAAFINANFDGVVFTFSNDLRNSVSDFGLTDLIRNVTIPIYVFGLGGENYSNLRITSSLSGLLKLFNDKASIFSVRGHSAETFLLKMGLDNVVALGCPSLMIVAKNIIDFNLFECSDNINLFNHEGGLKILVAGRLVPFSSPSCRTGLLIQGLNIDHEHILNYVFQDELQHYVCLFNTYGLYNNSTGELNASILKHFLYKSVLPIPFKHFYAFKDISSWRQHCFSYGGGYDAFVGDRIHGGVVCLQVGIPSLILFKDDRVKELCNYHGLPSCSLDTFSKIGVSNAVNSFLTSQNILSMKKRLLTCFSKFSSHLNRNGLTLVR